jgi:GTP-binding protein
MQFQAATIDYNNFVGRIAVGRLHRGIIRKNQPLVCIDADGEHRQGKVLKLIGYKGLTEIELEEASAGDIIGVAGVGDVLPGETLCAPSHPDALPPIAVDEPTVSIELRPNDGPLSGDDGKFVTAREIGDRLEREIQSNVSLRIGPGSSPEAFKVSGRGELHLCVLIETMRREGFEFTVSMPQVIIHESETGAKTEPYEDVVIEVDEPFAGAVIQSLNQRGGELKDMQTSEGGITRLSYNAPSRGLIGYRNTFLTQTRGTGTLYHTLSEYGPYRGEMRRRTAGVLVAMKTGRVTGYALETLQERGTMFVEPGDQVYAGQVVGENARPTDMPCNPTKPRKLDNMRSATKELDIRLDAARKFTLEEALEYIADDELMEITPKSIRIRKRLLDENDRKRLAKKNKIAPP